MYGGAGPVLFGVAVYFLSQPDVIRFVSSPLQGKERGIPCLSVPTLIRWCAQYISVHVTAPCSLFLENAYECSWCHEAPPSPILDETDQRPRFAGQSWAFTDTEERPPLQPFWVPAYTHTSRRPSREHVISSYHGPHASRRVASCSGSSLPAGQV